MRSETASRTPEGDDGDDGLELRRNRFGSQEVRVADVTLASTAGSVGAGLSPGADLRVGFRLLPREPVDDRPAIVVSVRRTSDGLICLEANSEADGIRLPRAQGPIDVDLALGRLDLQPGAYSVDVGVYRSDWSYAYDYHWAAYELRIAGDHAAGVLRGDHRWTVDA